MKSPQKKPRNPGPIGGYWIILFARRWVPRPIFRALVIFGTWIAVFTLRDQRAGSRRYLTSVLKRPPTLTEVHQHFLSFADSLIEILWTAKGNPHRVYWAEGEGSDFEETLAKFPIVLFGTFHLGNSDLLGYLLGNFGRQVSMIRIRVANSADTELAQKQFGDSIRFIWVDDPQNLSFAVKNAVERGESLAMKCDRVEGARKTEVFTFLGEEIIFPFTIYHLSRLFSIPVLFAFGFTDEAGGTISYAAPAFVPVSGAKSAEHLTRAKDHFQTVLSIIEDLLRERPYAWHNFKPLPLGKSDR